MKAYTADEARNRLQALRALKTHVEAEMEDMARVIASTQRPRLRRRSRHEIPPCGTESAYQRHRYYGEHRDDDCTRAHAEHTAEKARERRQQLDQVMEGAA